MKNDLTQTYIIISNKSLRWGYNNIRCFDVVPQTVYLLYEVSLSTPSTSVGHGWDI